MQQKSVKNITCCKFAHRQVKIWNFMLEKEAKLHIQLWYKRYSIFWKIYERKNVILWEKIDGTRFPIFNANADHRQCVQLFNAWREKASEKGNCRVFSRNFLLCMNLHVSLFRSWVSWCCCDGIKLNLNWYWYWLSLETFD